MNPCQFSPMGYSQFPSSNQFSLMPNQNQNYMINSINSNNNHIDMKNQQYMNQNNSYLSENSCNQFPFHANHNNQQLNFNIQTKIPSKYKQPKPHPKTKFTNQEDLQLCDLVKKYGTNNWYQISKEMNGRNIRQCRERYNNYLTPEINNGPWTKEEDDLLFDLFSKYGARWKLIASFFPTRTDINIKSRWQVHFRRYIRQTKNIIKKKLNNQQSSSMNCNLTYNKNNRFPSQSEIRTNNSNATPLFNQQTICCATLPIPSISCEIKNFDEPKSANITSKSDFSEFQQEKSTNLATEQNDQNGTNLSEANNEKNTRDEFDDIFNDFVDTSFFDPSMSLYDAYKQMESGMGF